MAVGDGGCSVPRDARGRRCSLPAACPVLLFPENPATAREVPGVPSVLSVGGRACPASDQRPVAWVQHLQVLGDSLVFHRL